MRVAHPPIECRETSGCADSRRRDRLSRASAYRFSEKSIRGGVIAPQTGPLADRARRLDHIWVSPALKEGFSDFRITRMTSGCERPSRPRVCRYSDGWRSDGNKSSPSPMCRLPSEGASETSGWLKSRFAPAIRISMRSGLCAGEFVAQRCRCAARVRFPRAVKPAALGLLNQRACSNARFCGGPPHRDDKSQARDQCAWAELRSRRRPLSSPGSAPPERESRVRIIAVH